METKSDTPARWKALGPGLLVAATGVGAGDLIAAALAGQRYGLAVLWVVVVGAACKGVLNEGIARWQLATGESVIAGWRKRLPAWVSWYFGGYLVVWGFMVAGAVGSACGVAAKTLWPDSSLGIEGWTIIHVVVGYVLVRWGRYAFYEKIMEGLIAIMFAVVIFCGVQLAPSFSEFAAGLFIPTVPEGSIWFVLGLMGGVGGSATLLCYGYWLQEKGWSGKDWMPRSRWDLGVAYSLTGLFGLAMVVIAAGAKPEDASGPALVVALSERLGIILGTTGRTIFLGGFWCAVFSSLLGVFQGVPYLFSDWWRCRGKRSKSVPGKFTQSSAYRYFLLFLAGPPLLLQLLGKPLLVVVIYAVVGAFFMPFLAGTLLVMNNRKEWVAEFKNSWPVNVGLIVSLVLFALLFLSEIGKQLFA